MSYLLRREQFIPRPRAEVFDFFSKAENLDFLTPPWLHFRILTPLPIAMHCGTLIRYRIRWRLVPVGWTTEIKVWDPPFRFVDQQLKGPYRLWHHTHAFEETADGTRMTDEVRYALPWGPLGSLAHACIVRRDLEAIFDYRYQQVAKQFS